MKVQINKNYYDFVSNYNPKKPSENGWKKQNQDAFKICQFDKHDVFIKRFERTEAYIVGYQFLVKIKNQQRNGLPIIYDIVTVIENKQSVTYLFQQALKGKTLEEIIYQGDTFIYNPKKIIKDLYEAFSTIFNYGYWFADFVEKNIFVCENGNYCLIDLDSVVPLSILPNSDNPKISQVNKNYKIAVSIYWYKNTFYYPYAYIAKNLRGDTINILALLIFIVQLNFYIHKNGNVNFLDVQTRKAIPNYLLNLNNSTTYKLFKSCFPDSTNYQRPITYTDLITFIDDTFGSDIYEINFSSSHILKFAKDAIALTKGENIPFSKINMYLNSIQVKLDWCITQFIKSPFDVDICIFLLTCNDIVRTDEDFIFYNQPKSPNGAVSIISNNSILINLKSIPKDIVKIVIGLSIYQAHIHKYTFNSINNVSIYIFDNNTDKELFYFNLPNNYTHETVMILGEVYKRNNEWKFRAVGQGYQKGLYELCNRYGVKIN